ncbi:acetyltransferase [Edwardsiella piscicida]|uniref:Sialic acid synthase n=2 Tax=Edwardsiella piscicida TaxID=1263550 RepID=A0AAU8P7F4_EDWPI|nr:acetyltransferase [Edwardsiella piscicida]ACY84049.1 sialic acid synthase [Edwardsiella tarda EIB202]ARD17209.1 shikimate dehydrogenase [Edwardsiella piscicida]ELM3656735.1 acetyltransferase [Edwardsiella piscicida]ELM3721899.1 acetyltransferase [Edwardsiella piscicida]ELM3735750.1 acetyltransferase [Edwardsiella piscicida]
MRKLIIIGAGGFSKSIISSIDVNQLELIGFIDTYKQGVHQGYPILANAIEKIDNFNDYVYFIGIGEPKHRWWFYQRLMSKGLSLVNIIDSSALIDPNVTLGNGIYIGKMCIVNSDTIIHDAVVINTRALVEHGNTLGCCSNISTNAVLNGDVQVGQRTFVGSCSVINGQLTIGNGSIIGSGSVVIRDIPDNVVVAGSPTRLIRENYDE